MKESSKGHLTTLIMLKEKELYKTQLVESPKATPSTFQFNMKRRKRLKAPPLPQNFYEYQYFLRQALLQAQAFKNCSEAELDLLMAIVEPKHLRRDEILFRQGQPTLGFYIVATGTVLLQVVNSGSRKHIYGAFREGASFGESFLGEESLCPFEGKALEDSIALLFPREKLLSILYTQPKLSVQLILSMSLRMNLFVQQLSDFKIHAVEQRFYAWIARHIPEGADSFGIELGMKRILAAELGITSETLSRLQRRVKESGIATIKGRYLMIPDCRAFKEHLRQSANAPQEEAHESAAAQ